MKKLLADRRTTVILPMLLLICGLPGLSYGQDAPDAIVQFSDRTLAITVRISIDLESLTPPNLGVVRMPEAEVLKIPKTELTKLTYLRASDQITDDLDLPAITDLTGLEHATQLRTIDFRGQNVIDLTPLSQLTQLTQLDLGGNEISDITPLAQLTQLKWLSLGGNRIIDIAPLTQLTRLTDLSLGKNKISDITPLAQLTQLTSLKLFSNRIIDIASLTQFTRLTDLNLGGNEISDISPLAQLTRLTDLNLGSNQIRDITPLAKLTKLTQLLLTANQIRDITSLGQLTQLTYLFLGFNQIRDVTPLAQLVNLEYLWSAHNQIRDVSPLASLVHLKSLRLGGNPITDTHPLGVLLDENPNLDIDIEIIREKEIPTVTASTSHSLTATTLNGSVVTLTLSSGEFDLTARIRDAVTISGVAGISFHRTDIEKVSDTEVRIKLTFDGTIETDATLSVTVGSGAIKNYTGAEQTADIPVSAISELIASTAAPLTKATLDGSKVILTLQDKSYELGGSFSAADGGVSVLGIPDVTVRGFGLDIFRLNDTQISVRLNFGGNFDDDRTLTFLVSAEVIANYSGPPLAAELPVAASTETSITPEIPISAATLKFLPSPVQSPAVGKQLMLSLNIADGENVAGYQATIQFDGTALRYISSAIGDYLPAGAFPLPVNSSGNTVTLGAVSLAGESDGDGTLATITFEVIQVKESTLTLSDVLLSDSAETASRPQVEDGRIVEPPPLEEDVNGDGVVNILDLVRVASSFGKSGENGADVNGDGVVNILDLVRVAGALGNVAAAPSAWYRDLEIAPTRTVVKEWLAQAQTLDLTDATSREGVLFLQRLFAALTPKETALLPNYPNPFNPETWIPYQLAHDAEVRVTIYDINGAVMRILDLGYQQAGFYTDKGSAAYWDGRDRDGELVASGIYFYALSAADFAVTRRMLILK